MRQTLPKGQIPRDCIKRWLDLVSHSAPAEMRDAPARTGLLRPLIARLGQHAVLHLVTDSNYSFDVPARSGTKELPLLSMMLDPMVEGILSVSAGQQPNNALNRLRAAVVVVQPQIPLP